LSIISYIVPARWFVQLSRDAFVRGGGWVYDWYLPVILAAEGMFFFAIAVNNMRRMQLKD
jgi:ABC-2 type transport system permease protein